MSEVHTERLTAPAALSGQRLDKALAVLLPQYSRARLQAWIEAGAVQVNGAVLRRRDKLTGGEAITVRVMTEIEVSAAPQAIPLDIVYADAALLVINKPAGLVVHPGAGIPGGTLLNALLHHAPEVARVPRAGIVHRLDKDTSGLLVVARTLRAHTALVAAMQARAIEREYEAVVCGVMTAGGSVDAPIGRHPRDRRRMTVRQGERKAVTHYRVLQRFRAHTHVRVRLDTGRTHQIRVHFQHIRFPIVGDPVYGRRLALPPKAAPALVATLGGFRRQALHAGRLALRHPVSGKACIWEAPLPEDMQGLLSALRQDAGLSEGNPPSPPFTKGGNAKRDEQLGTQTSAIHAPPFAKGGNAKRGGI